MADPVVGIAAELVLLGEAFAKAFEKELNRSHDAAKRFETAVQREFDRINGTKATAQVELIGKAVERMGGLAKLSGQQVDNLRARVEALAKAGARLPSSLAGLGQAAGPGVGGVLAGNLQTQGLGALQSQLGPFGGILTGLSGPALAAGAAIAGVGVAAAGAATAIAAATVEFADFSGHLVDLSAQTGIGTTALQELEFAGSFVGVSLDEITSAVGRMQKGIAEGDTVFQRLGLNLESLAALKPEEQFFKVAEAINGIQDPARKTAAAIEVFGKSGAALLPLFNDMTRLREEAHRLGVVFGEDAVKQGDKLDDAFTRLSAATEGLGRAFGSLAGSTGLIAFLENLAAGLGEVSAHLPQLLELFERLAPFLAGTPGGGIISSLAQLSGLAGAAAGVGGAGGVGADPQAASAAARAALAQTKFETAAEEAKRKKALEEAERAAKKFEEALRKARVEAFELNKQIEEVGDEAATGLGQALFGVSTAGLLGLPETISVSSEAMAEAEGRAQALEQALAEKAAAEERAKKEAEEHAVALEQLAFTLGGIQFALGSLVGFLDAVGIAADSGLGRLVSGLSDAAGSAAGFVASISSGDILGAIGHGISGITSLGKAIGGLFGKSDAEKAGEIAGRVLGTAISEELANAISETSKALDISKEMASLLHLGDAMDESGQSAVAFGDQMTSLLQAIEGGAVPAAEGIAALGDAFSRLAEEAEAGSVGAMVQMGKLAQEARAFGQSIPEIDAAVRSAISDSTGALGALGGLTLVDAEDARAQAQIFLNVFNSVLATDGIVAAAQAIKPALDTFREQLSAAGIGKGVADSILGPIQGAMSLLKNDMTKGGAEGAQALKTILESQLKAGFLDTNTFAAIQQQAGTAFDQMIEGGASTKAALQAVAPLLAQIQATASATGEAIDPVSQKLIEQAQAAGIAFPVDTGQQMVTLLGQVVELLGGIPETFSEVGSATTSTFDTISTDAMQTSSTVVGAFDGVGQQITTAIAPAGEALQQGLAGIFDTATQEAMEFAGILKSLDNTTLTIPFKFEGGEDGLPDFGTKLPQFAGGGEAHGPKSGYLAVLHGDELVTPLDGPGRRSIPGQQIAISMPVTINGSGLSEEQLVRVVDRGIKNNTGEIATRIRRVIEGGD